MAWLKEESGCLAVLVKWLCRCFVVTVFLNASSCTNSGDFEKLRRSVFKIYVVSQEAKPLMPWESEASSSSSGSGFYIGDGRILTNAHVVANAKYVKVLRDGQDQTVPAQVTFIAHDCDLAILTVKKANYFDDVKTLNLGSLPKVRSPVSAVGYPLGGDQLSITEGVVSRIGFRRYSHTGSDEHLLVQVDSAINPGNSGGPVLQEGKVIGVAFQGNASAQNTGYIIPTAVVERFLTDIKDGTYDGHPELGVMFLPDVMENPSTQKYYGVTERKNFGVKLTDVASYAPAFAQLKPDDVLLAIDGHAIGADGRINFEKERVDFRVISDLKQIGDDISFELLRDGSSKTIIHNFKLTKSKSHPKDGRSFAKRPKYFVFSGLVFSALNQNYLRTWGNRWYEDAPTLLRYLLYYWRFNPLMEDDTDVVVLANRLPAKVNAYADLQRNSVVKTINGQAIKSVADVAKAFSKLEGEFIVVEFFEGVEPIVLSRQEAVASNEVINERYRVNPTQWLGDVDGTALLGDK